jgi:hypothetical protein
MEHSTEPRSGEGSPLDVNFLAMPLDKFPHFPQNNTMSERFASPALFPFLQHKEQMNSDSHFTYGRNFSNILLNLFSGSDSARRAAPHLIF